MLLDSNVLIYASKAKDLEDKAAKLVKQTDACVSAITCVEVLGYHSFKGTEKTDLETMLEYMTIFLVSEQVIESAISLRQQKSMSLGDSIIAATALVHGKVLYTRNTDDFKWIAGLQLVNPFVDYTA
ncbi:type II toxin-antitoxin system VapC family toxin [Thiothrix subterranea]|uniref:Type II toxin-antitoxin system VapC family toxin n=1 Tax=Thiothrix subterranea TaxID=2735563 RepID=A0AA51R056_9GAMM|nr:type II toxin-antitoxin system VapC family toxin [Thiothrix subterranea]MDQ5768149.1 type II toxin-antitoxin system VapC family toxin [Thiothrix subterranea]WML85329.1 type II toxin-antitoxin system VapC family toxin [Thiothrix subterranea]